MAAKNEKGLDTIGVSEATLLISSFGNSIINHRGNLIHLVGILRDEDLGKNRDLLS